jgi:hypothetical protein
MTNYESGHLVIWLSGHLIDGLTGTALETLDVMSAQRSLGTARFNLRNRLTQMIKSKAR